MGTKSVYFPESTTRARSQVVNIPDLGTVTSVTVDTGQVTYSVSGKDVTVNVSNGIMVRDDSLYKYVSYYLDYDTPSNFPVTYPYSDGDGYSGDIPKSGSYYLISGSAGDSKPGTGDMFGTVTSRFTWDGVGSWSRTSSWYDPPQLWYDDGTYTGFMPVTGTDAYPAFPPTSAGTGQASGYTTTRSTDTVIHYGGTVYSDDTRVYRQDYYGEVKKAIFIYAYNVTINYTSSRPSNFEWSTTKYIGGNPPTATEWNDLMEKIRAFRTYKGLPQVSYVVGYSGNPLTAIMFNQAVAHINSLNPPFLPPTTRATGDDLYAHELNQFRDSLNSVT